MAATTGLGVGMFRCTRLRPSIPHAPSLPSLPFPGGGAGAARRRPPGRGKAEEAMATTRLEAPGQSLVMLAEATRSSHHILVTILTIGMLLPDLRLLTQVHSLEDRKCKASLNSYTNRGYGPPYPTGPGTNTASYPGAYYTPGYAQTNYSTEVPSTYRSPGNSPTPVSRWMYPQQDCQTEAPPLRGQVPGYPASQNSGMRVPYYPYGDGDHSVPQPGPTI